MAAANFAHALALLLVHEGGKTDDPHDPGGRTNWGITHIDYDKYRRGKGLPLRDVFLMDKSECEDIYRSLYWNEIRGDDLPAGLDYVVFDGGVNSGNLQSIKWLQRALPALPANGRVSDALLGNAAQCADVSTLIKAVCEARREFLQNLSTFQYFGRGWIRRVDDVQATALAWAAGSPAPTLSSSTTGPQPKALRESASALPSTAPGDVIAAASGALLAATLALHVQTAPVAPGPAPASSPLATETANTPVTVPAATTAQSPTNQTAPAQAISTQATSTQSTTNQATTDQLTAAQSTTTQATTDQTKVQPPSQTPPVVPPTATTPPTNTTIAPVATPPVGTATPGPAPTLPQTVTTLPANPSNPLSSGQNPSGTLPQPGLTPPSLTPVPAIAPAPSTMPAITAKPAVSKPVVTASPQKTTPSHLPAVAVTASGKPAATPAAWTFTPAQCGLAAAFLFGLALSFSSRARRARRLDALGDNPQPKTKLKTPTTNAHPVQIAKAPAPPPPTVADEVLSIPIVRSIYARILTGLWVFATIAINVIVLAKLLQTAGFAHESWHQPFLWLGNLYDTYAGQAFSVTQKALSAQFGFILPAWALPAFILYVTTASAFVAVSSGLMQRDNTGEAFFAAVLHAGWIFAVPSFVFNAVRYRVVTRFARQNTTLFFAYLLSFFVVYVGARFINDDILPGLSKNQMLANPDATLAAVEKELHDLEQRFP